MFRFILPKMIFKCERWKWNSEYRVYVSTLGHFKDEYKDTLPPKVNNGGYLMIKTRCGLRLAHRLVLQTWRPCPDYDNLTVDHLNHNKRDNSLSNLEWVTQEENLRRAEEDKVNVPSVDTVPKFNSYKQAADWAIQHNKCLQNDPNVKRDTVANKIKNAAMNNKKYCGMYWEKIN